MILKVIQQQSGTTTTPVNYENICKYLFLEKSPGSDTCRLRDIYLYVNTRSQMLAEKMIMSYLSVPGRISQQQDVCRLNKLYLSLTIWMPAEQVKSLIYLYLDVSARNRIPADQGTTTIPDTDFVIPFDLATDKTSRYYMCCCLIEYSHVQG